MQTTQGNRLQRAAERRPMRTLVIYCAIGSFLGVAGVLYGFSRHSERGTVVGVLSALGLLTTLVFITMIIAKLIRTRKVE